MKVYFIYPIYTAVLAIIARALIPLSEIKRLFFFSLIFGAAIDAVIVLSYQSVGWFEYKNFGPFGFFGIPFFPLIAWTCYFLLYFYFIPRQKFWMYVYVVFASFYSFLFSIVLENLDILQWHLDRTILPVLTYLIWNMIATWGYLKLSGRETL